MYNLLVCWFLNIDEKITYSQQEVPLYTKHWELMLVCFFTLLLSIFLLLISSFKFLLRFKAVTGSFWTIHNDFLIDKMFQSFRTTLLICSSNLLCLTVILADIFFLLEWYCLFLLKVPPCPFFHFFLIEYIKLKCKRTHFV